VVGGGRASQIIEAIFFEFGVFLSVKANLLYVLKVAGEEKKITWLI